MHLYYIPILQKCKPCSLGEGIDPLQFCKLCYNETKYYYGDMWAKCLHWQYNFGVVRYSMHPIPVKKLNEQAILPTYGSCEAAGADLYACLDEDVVIQPGCDAWIKTGIAMELPLGYAGLIYARSGLACKRGLAPANKVGVVDSDYRGEIVVVLHNHGNQSQVVSHGERIAQLVITPVFTPGFECVQELHDSSRGQGGFGSTGK